MGRAAFGSNSEAGTFVSQTLGNLVEVNGFVQPGVNLQGGLNVARLMVIRPRWTPTSVNEKRQPFGAHSTRATFSRACLPRTLPDSVRRGRPKPADIAESDSAILSNGNIIWGGSGRDDSSNYVVTDQTGTGDVYILRRKDEQQNGTIADFFQVQSLGGAPISRTQGLFDQPSPFAQWDNSVARFAVNPIDPDGIIMGSAESRLYRTTDEGLNWFDIGNQTFDNTYTSALAFGAPLTSTSALNDYIYAGTRGGKIYVTTLGGGDATKWTDISAGLDGAEVQKIVTNPVAARTKRMP